MSPSLAFTAAFSIFLREGFEAVLIIIVLIGILKAMGATQALKWVHVGWSSALAVGILAWFASDSLMTMSGASRELMEGAISLFAVVVLLYVGFWLHRHSQISKWKEFLEAQVKRAQENKTYSAIAGISFIAVFREAFEVVLFLRAIWLDLDSSGQTVAGFGVLTSFGVIMAFSYLAVKTSQKLPLKQLFTFCSITMVALAVILAGKGVHSLQEAGYLSALPLSFGMRSELIGLYPTLQGVLSQITLAAGISIFLLYEKLMPAMSKVRSRDN